MNTFRIEGTITTALPESKWWELFELWLSNDEFKADIINNELSLFPNGEDLIELSKQETNFDVM